MSKDEHPIGPPKHGIGMQVLRIVLFAIYFFGSGLFIHGTQLLGVPLYLISKDWYYAWMALTKQHFGLLLTTMTQWWSPTAVRISGDKSVAGLIHQKKNGLLELQIWRQNNYDRQPPNLHGVVVLMVDRVYKQPTDTWAHLHRPEGLVEMDSAYWARNAVLQLHLHGEKVGDGSGSVEI